MPPEIEAKFQADDPRPLAALTTLERLGRADLGPARVVDEVDRYLDTGEGTFAAAGWACRLRTRGASTIVSFKGPARTDARDGVHERPEIEGPATDSTDPAAWPDSAARSFADELRRGHALREIARLDQRRTERSVTTGGRRVGVLSLDEVTVVGAPRGRDRLHTVELEIDPAAGGTAALAPLAAALARLDGLVPDPTSKLEHALERLGRR
jgi:inorganic triphosphatase YgiF